ncbi:MAG: branched-chain amino acid aminotransferase [Edaphocola sp.]
MSVSTLAVHVSKTDNSRIHPLTKENLVFGRENADHMLVCDYEEGAWQTPEIVPFGNFSLSPSTSFIHYGQAIFEGVKAYRQPDGSIAIFRPYDNWKRMNVSAHRMGMPEIPEEIFMEGMRQLIELDAAWVPAEDETSLYIRPFMIGMDEFIGVRPSDTYRFAIITSPAGAYYNKPVRIYVQDHYVRAAKGGIGFTKAAGNYGASMLPAAEIRKLGYDQNLWTDAVENKYVQEIGTMNVFFIVDGVALTPDLNSGTILAGVTRASVITLLRENGIKVEERPISIDELIEAGRNGKLQEAFGTGTAASMSFIAELTYKTETLALPGVDTWAIAPKIKKELDDIRYGRIEDKHGWLFRV